MTETQAHTAAEATLAFLLALRARGLRDTALLRALETVPRGRFVPRRFADLALQDVGLPIACGQTLPAPSHIATLISALDVKPTHRILEIGTGAGYMAALLGRLGRDVVSIERFRSLAVEAAARLNVLGFTNVHIFHGDGQRGHLERAPYDRIVVDASFSAPPPALMAQLAEDGVLVGVGRGEGAMRVMRVKKLGGAAHIEWGVPLAAAPLASGIASAL
jgi:protein-L-isoaspartate(D-aspartate) O-methyltransferase